MKISVATVCLFALLGAAGSVAAENPFAGTWKRNQAKSHLTGDTVKFADAGSGAIRSTASAMPSYTFKTDGKAYPIGGASLLHGNSLTRRLGRPLGRRTKRW